MPGDVTQWTPLFRVLAYNISEIHLLHEFKVCRVCPMLEDCRLMSQAIL